MEIADRYKMSREDREAQADEEYRQTEEYNRNMSFKNDMIMNFISLIENNSDINKYVDINLLSQKVNDNLLWVVREPWGTEFLNSIPGMEAAVWGRNMFLRPGQDINSLMVVHEMLHIASSQYIKTGAKTIHKSGFTEEVRESSFFERAFYRPKSISRNRTSIIEETFIEQESGNGFTEGVTECLARRLTNESLHMPKYNAIQQSGQELVDDDAYSGEQTLVEEFMAFFGMDGVVKSYFSNNTSFMVEQMGNVPDAKEMLNQFFMKVDKLNGADLGKKYKACFKECQEFFNDNFVMNELQGALLSGDLAKVSDMRDRIQRVMELGFKIDGKNVFDKVAKEFNQKISELDIEIEEIPIPTEKPIQRIQRIANQIISPIVQMGMVVREVIEDNKKQKKVLMLESGAVIEDREKIVEAQDVVSSDMGDLPQTTQKEQNLRDSISGLGKLSSEEREAKYKAAEQEWEERKASREAQIINNHERDSGEMEK